MSEQQRIISEALDQFSDDELEAEVKRRGQIRDTTPIPLEKIDWSMVENLALDYIDIIERNVKIVGQGWTSRVAGGDTERYVFEAVIQAVYGKDVWEWINKRLQ